MCGERHTVAASHIVKELATNNIVDNLTKQGSTCNLCAVDLSKAFDKVNHHALYLKLMKRLVPNELLNLLEFWLSGCYSCVKWFNDLSNLFPINFGVRQGSVLSPTLFAIGRSRNVCDSVCR